MSDSLQMIQEQLKVLGETARKYEIKKKRDAECARMSYHRRMARERNITLEEWFKNPPKRGRPKKIVE